MTKKFDTEIENIASKSLGDSTSYAVYTDQVDSELLNPMPRSAGFDSLNLEVDHIGSDVWHGHEMTFLLDSGAPFTGTLKIVYDANTKYMVESKSFKVYLNTFDMCKMGPTINEAVFNVERCISNDLSKIVEGDVLVKFFPDNTVVEDFDVHSDQFIPLEELVDIEKVQFDDYNGNAFHLEAIESTKGKNIKRYKTNSLRSRCKVTKQRDIGSAFITIEAEDVLVTPESLLKQIVSLREQDEFHEFCSSKLYSEIMSVPGVVGCSVTLLYSRRGSLDICPTRATHVDLLPSVLPDVTVLTRKTQGQ